METNHLPTTHTSFIGRDVEYREIAQLLSNSPCRLLTLVGPGGIGKTRLALEAMRQFSFPHGVYFVSLQSLTSPAFMLSTLADALGFQFYSGADPKQQLLDYVSEKSLLLVLDNLEHLLEGVTLLSDILAAAPRIRVLATSRERLNLREEWVLEVKGLQFPPTDAELNLEPYSAIHLFLQHTRRANVNFTLTDAQKPAVIRICRLIGGMPLAIELSATWVKVLSCEQIAHEIERSLDILETGARNIEPRHRSMRAVLDQSWQLLSHAERDTCRRLSVFRGSFSREAAEYVAGTSLRVLTALLDKSLLRLSENGRYDLQELVRQYAEEKLAEQPGEREQVCELHCDYYVDFMGQWTDNIVALYQRPALDRILSDIDNVRVAYRWAVKQRKLTALEKFLQTLPHFVDLQDTYQEGLEMLRLVVDILPEPRDEQQTRLLGLSLAWQSWFLRSLERDDEARQLLEKSLALLLPFGNGREIFYAYQFLTQLSYDNPLEMKRFAEAALKCAEEAFNFRWGHIGICQLLSWALAELGEYDEAQRRLDYAVMLCRTDHNLSGETWTYMHLSHLAACQQNWSEAKKWSQQGFAVAEKIGYQYAMAVHQYGLGEIAYHFGNYDEAKLHFQAGLKLAQELGNQKHVTLALEQIREIESVRSSSNLHQSNTTSANPLTERELEVLRLIAEGLSNREIAERQILAISTVKWYINEIFSKLHVTTRTQAVVQARAFGLLA